jgi:iron complex outermembrane recepter protein
MFLTRARIALYATFTLSLAYAGALHAASADSGVSDAPVLQEIVVTAQKRAQNLQDVGTSITALDAQALANLGPIDATDLVSHVPGLQFNWFGPSLLVFNLRGVSQNDYADHQEGPVAVYSDEAYVGAGGALAGSLYDLERVEVLRGPQGTLFGRNATGGLIQYISNKPTNTPSGNFEATGGMFGDLDTEGAINGPLTDTLSARWSFATTQHDGLIHNRIGRDVEGENEYATRLQFLWKASDAVESLLKIYGLRDINAAQGDYSWAAAYPGPHGLGNILPPTVNYWGTCPGCDLDGYRNPSSNVFDQAISNPGRFDRTIYGATEHLKFELSPDVTLTSVTDYLHMLKNYFEHSNPSPVSPIYFGTGQTYRQFTEELRLNGEVSGLRWITGLYYMDRHSDDQVLSVFNGLFTIPPAYNAGTDYTIETKSAAIFGQVEKDLASRLTVIVGARYTQDKLTDNYVLYDYPQTGPPVPTLTFNPSTYPGQADRTFGMFSGKVEAQYKITPEALLYASASQGTKGGGFSAPSFNTSIFGSPPLTAQRLVFDPEKLISYEIGEKYTFFHNAARLNASVFYYDYQDYQGLTAVNFLNTVGNYPATIKGGELEFEIYPAKRLDVQLGISGLDGSVRNVPLPDGTIAERVMPQAPKWSLTGLLRYEWPMWNGSLFAQTDWKWDDNQYFTMLNNPDDFEKNHVAANVSVGFKASNWTVTLWVRNLTDRIYRIYNSDASGFGFDQPVYAPPRWAGATVAYHF